MDENDDQPDNDGFDVQHCTAWIMAVAMKQVRNKDDAEEVAQMVLVAILENVEKVRSAKNPKAYVCGMIAHAACALYRQRSAPGPKTVRGIDSNTPKGRRKGVIPFSALEATCHDDNTSWHEVQSHKHLGSGSMPAAPDECAMVRERAEGSRTAVGACMKKLPKHFRAALALVVMDGQSYAEAAAQLQVNPDTLKSHVNRGKKAMAKMLGARWAD